VTTTTAVLDRLPPLAHTGVGSLPFVSADAAVRHVRRAYTVPFCPQLPRLDGDMIREWLGADPAGCGWSPDRDRERPAAWDAFLAAVRTRPPEHGVVKLQVTGPITLAVALERSAGRCGFGGDVPALARELAIWLAASVSAQTRALAASGLRTLLLVDEPGLAAAALPLPSLDVWDPLRGAADAWGLHICGAVPWNLISVLRPDALSFDLRHERPQALALLVLDQLIARGGRIIWGVVDPVAPGDPERASALLNEAMRDLGPLPQVAAASLISPACGTGRLSPATEERVAGDLAVIAGP
jgi:hypothetical protein